MTSNMYNAVTIGPIYKTFNQAKRTRSVWAASYFFSWFIKQVVIKCKASGFKILLPYSDDLSKCKSIYGSGLFADRVYFEPCDKSEADLKLVIDEIINEVAEDISKSEKGTVKEFLKQYLNVHIVSAPISVQKDVLFTLNQMLDQRELYQNFAFEMEQNHLLNYLDQKLSEGSLLVNDAFNNKKGLRFRSLSEIASTTIERLQEKEYSGLLNTIYKEEKKNIDIDFFEKMKEDEALKDILKPHHKYYAVLYADGDNIGTLLTKISGDFVELRKFSEKLFEFGVKAEKKIKEYGGNGIYLGGEDIMAFLPMACISESKNLTNTLFNIVEDLDRIFDETIADYAVEKGVEKPTLSFGIQVSYIKHPLKEAMGKAYKLLETVKTGVNNEGVKLFPVKNTIGFAFEKHSGQRMECFIEKAKSASTEVIFSLMADYTKDASLDNAEILSGVIHKLQNDIYFETFSIAATKGRLEHFFENFFNEEVHKGEENPKNIFLKRIRGLSEIVFREYSDKENARKILYTILRVIHFINSDKD